MTSLFVGLRCTGRQIRETASVYVQMAWVKGGGVVELHQRVSAPLREYRSQGGVTSPAPPFSPCFLFVSSSLRPPPIFFFFFVVCRLATTRMSVPRLRAHTTSLHKN
jgi:hypothetical protein